MLFRTLRSSPALSLERYADIDHFRESERYAGAESIPLGTGEFSVLRARLALPSCNLSLVRTFPRLINGFEMPGRMILVIPMDDVASTKVNGEPIGGHSLLLFKGNANCTVHEPEGRLVAIVSVPTAGQDLGWQDFGDGHLLMRLQPFQIASLQRLIRNVLELAAVQPDIIRSPDMLQSLNTVLFAALDAAMCAGEIFGLQRRRTMDRYKSILDGIDAVIAVYPTEDLTCESLAAELGVSVRTLQTATQSVCGAGAHHYSRLRRLWSVRRQLRTGAAGLTVKASALANGFGHMGEFSGIYRYAFGETPSQTLARSRQTPVRRTYAALAPS
ncbi:MAG: helix-turn-helix domain-containing protein [bacterium]|nr:helix-turn-helix domain-containing protein [bacterium]